MAKQVEKQNWVVRMPGGPTRIVRVDAGTSESLVRDVYRQSVRCRRAASDSDVDAVWPLCQTVSEDEIRKNYQWLLDTSTVTGAARGLVEV